MTSVMKRRMFQSFLFAFLFALCALPFGVARAGEEAEGTEDAEFQAANDHMKRLTDELNEISNLMTSKANFNCKNCQAIMKRFEQENNKLTDAYTNQLNKLMSANAEAPAYIKLANNYNQGMENLVRRYKTPAMSARDDSLCGKCNLGGPQGGRDEE